MVYLYNSQKEVKKRENRYLGKLILAGVVFFGTSIIQLSKYIDFNPLIARYTSSVPQREVIDMSEFIEVDKDSLENTICTENARFGTHQVFSVDRENIGAIYPGDYVNPFSQTKYGTAWFQGGIDSYTLVGFNPKTSTCEGTAFFYPE